MSAKQNFNKAVYDMFGVGKEEEKNMTSNNENAKQAAAAQAAAPATPVTVVHTATAANKLTYLAAGAVLEGTLRVKGDIEIAGELKGELISEGNVVLRSNLNGNVTAQQLSMVGCAVVGDIKVGGLVLLDEKSSIQGNLFVDSIECAGRIKGDITAKGHSAFHSGARMDGNVTTNTFTVERGAVLSGCIKMGGLDDGAEE